MLLDQRWKFNKMKKTGKEIMYTKKERTYDRSIQKPINKRSYFFHNKFSLDYFAFQFFSIPSDSFPLLTSYIYIYIQGDPPKTDPINIFIYYYYYFTK